MINNMYFSSIMLIKNFCLSTFVLKLNSSVVVVLLLLKGYQNQLSSKFHTDDNVFA